MINKEIIKFRNYKMTYDEYMANVGSVTPIQPKTKVRPVLSNKDVKEYVDTMGYAHTNPDHYQIDIDTVCWQLNNDPTGKSPKVTMQQLKTGEPYHEYKLHDAREGASPDPDPSPGPTPDPSIPDWQKDEHGGTDTEGHDTSNGIPDIIDNIINDSKWSVIN